MKTFVVIPALLSLLVVSSCQDCMESSSLLNEKQSSRNEMIAISSAKSFLNELPLCTRGYDTREIGDVFPWYLNKTITRGNFHGVNENDTLFYIVNFKQGNGFVIVPYGDEIGRVLAFAETGYLNPNHTIENPGLSQYMQCLELYGLMERDVVDSLNMASPSPTGSHWVVDSIVPALIVTKWHQRNPFNLYCFTESDEEAPAGCVALAGAQIAAYHQYPDSLFGHTYDWNEIVPWPSSANAEMSVANLVHDIGIMTSTHYGANGSSSHISRLKDCFSNMGYTYSYYGTYDYSRSMSDFQQGMPIVLGGYDSSNNFAGHCWVADGGLTRSYHEIRYTLYGKEEIVTDTQQLIHCNWGWGGDGNGYYLSDAFQLSNTILPDSTDTSVNHNIYYFDYDLKAIYGISPQND